MVPPNAVAHGGGAAFFGVTIVNLQGRVGTALAASGASPALYRDTVLKAISAEQNPVGLVSHSFGNITIFNVAETVKFKIDTGHLPALINPEGLTKAIKTTAN